MLGVLVITEGSWRLGSVFVSLDTVSSRRCCRRRLLRGVDCERSFLIPCGRASINDQPKHTPMWITHARLLISSIAAQHFERFGLHDMGPCRLEGGLTTSALILPPRLMKTGEGGGRVRGSAPNVGGRR